MDHKRKAIDEKINVTVDDTFAYGDAAVPFSTPKKKRQRHNVFDDDRDDNIKTETPSEKDPRKYSKDWRDENIPVTPDSIMGFQRFPEETNRELLLKHPGFVQWARKLPSRNDNLEAFVQWADQSEEAKKLELEGMSHETFTFGKHKGHTFSRTYMEDPNYHVRYMRNLQKTKAKPPAVLERYMEWIKALWISHPSTTTSPCSTAKHE